MTKKNGDVITIPISVWESAETKEDLEDWLLAHNPRFVKRMLKAREEDLKGEVVSLEEVEKKLSQ
ncbi:hypothetical protein CEE36_05825 [candidate division TA06 bacterium B3_TA06]|uniref:Uncharacterized protein n=1 Tax=candidate division TA06 bacterium B3_TA06 TaxID=2012487 RepID=A0A532V724_UNCT6|nr:MAG: hypothetical protein CEE36_05825 [candidate division TA06 bacterium B3_TA06]